MRKFFCFLVIPALLLSGCQKKEEQEETIPVANDIEIIEAPETMPEMETIPEIETISIQERVSAFSDSETPLIYDDCHALTPDEALQFQEKFEELASDYEINLLLVITDHLDGNSPQQFAQQWYQETAELFNPNGFLILLNNDTNQDFIYLTGSCQEFITQEQIDTVLSGASYDLINQNYSGALSSILTLLYELPVYDENF